MSRRRSGKGWDIALRLTSGVLAVVCIVSLTLSAWFFGSQRALSDREVRTVEQLAEGRGRWVSVDDADLYVQEWGSTGRPTILLTHGTGAWSGTWFSLPQMLSDAGWRVVAVDLPPLGCRRRPPVTTRLTIHGPRKHVASLG